MELAVVVALAAIFFNTWKVILMSNGMEDLKAQVTSMSSVVTSAVELIQGIADKIDEAIAADDAAEDGELSQLAADLRADATRLGDAVAANTAAKEETPPAAPAEPEASAERPSPVETPPGPAEDPNV